MKTNMQFNLGIGTIEILYKIKNIIIIKIF